MVKFYGTLRHAKIVLFCIFGLVTILSVIYELAKTEHLALMVILLSWIAYFVMIDDLKNWRAKEELKEELEKTKAELHKTA